MRSRITNWSLLQWRTADNVVWGRVYTSFLLCHLRSLLVMTNLKIPKTTFLVCSDNKLVTIIIYRSNNLVCLLILSDIYKIYRSKTLGMKVNFLGQIKLLCNHNKWTMKQVKLILNSQKNNLKPAMVIMNVVQFWALKYRLHTSDSSEVSCFPVWTLIIMLTSLSLPWDY